MHQQIWVADENNRRIIGTLGRIIGEIFKPELQNRIIGKIKSILGSGLIVIKFITTGIPQSLEL